MKNKITLVLSVIFGLMFINAGLDKFFHYMPMPKDIPAPMMKTMTAMMEISWLMPLVGFAEVLGGLLIIFPKTRALGALVIFPVMVGIILMNTVTEPSGLLISAVFALILIWIMYDNREKYMQLISSRN